MAVVSPHDLDAAGRRSLVCSACGYGIARETPPGPCPMCRADDAWVEPPRRPLGGADDRVWRPR